MNTPKMFAMMVMAAIIGTSCANCAGCMVYEILSLPVEDAEAQQVEKVKHDAGRIET